MTRLKPGRSSRVGSVDEAIGDLLLPGQGRELDSPVALLEQEPRWVAAAARPLDQLERGLDGLVPWRRPPDLEPHLLTDATVVLRLKAVHQLGDRPALGVLLVGLAHDRGEGPEGAARIDDGL